MESSRVPHIAVISPNTLVCTGLRAIIAQIFPMAKVAIFSSLSDIEPKELELYFHYFVTPGILLGAQDFFSSRSHKVIVLVTPSSTDWSLYASSVSSYHTLDISLPEEDLAAEILQLARGMSQKKPAEKSKNHVTPLTAREQEVLRHIARGMMNKEIASCLGISLTTAISHRKKIQEKLRIRSVAGLTLYAVMHGLYSIE